MGDLCVVMVAYYPSERTYVAIDRLNEVFEIDRLVIVDNTPDLLDYFTQYTSLEKVFVIKNNRNLGIAKAQNIGIDYALENGFQWVLTTDQDTIIEKSLFLKFIAFYKNAADNIGVIATDYIDVSTQKPKFGNKEIIEVEETISSGSFLNLSVLKKIGGMKDNYFIDQVDNEYCYRLRMNGYRIVILPGIGMEHQLGNIRIVRFLWKKICIYNQSPMRAYYRTRNSIWFAREYKDRKLTHEKIVSLLYDLIRFLYEDEKLKKYKMFFKGVRDGLFIDQNSCDNNLL